MKRTDFIFDLLQLLYDQCHRINRKRCCSYIDPPDQIKKKKTTVNQKNTDDKCAQYAITIALNYGEIRWNPERVLNIKPFINKYNSKEISYPANIL